MNFAARFDALPVALRDIYTLNCFMVGNETVGYNICRGHTCSAQGIDPKAWLSVTFNQYSFLGLINSNSRKFKCFHEYIEQHPLSDTFYIILRTAFCICLQYEFMPLKGLKLQSADQMTVSNTGVSSLDEQFSDIAKCLEEMAMVLKGNTNNFTNEGKKSAMVLWEKAQYLTVLFDKVRYTSRTSIIDWGAWQIVLKIKKLKFWKLFFF